MYDGADPGTVIYVGNKKVGEFMKAKVFEPGRTLDWRELTKFATGEPAVGQGVRRGLQGALIGRRSRSLIAEDAEPFVGVADGGRLLVPGGRLRPGPGGDE